MKLNLFKYFPCRVNRLITEISKSVSFKISGSKMIQLNIMCLLICCPFLVMLLALLFSDRHDNQFVLCSLFRLVIIYLFLFKKLLLCWLFASPIQSAFSEWLQPASCVSFWSQKCVTHWRTDHMKLTSLSFLLNESLLPKPSETG